MTRISVVFLLTGTLTALALSSNGASASRSVKSKSHMPKVALHAPKPKVGKIEVQKETNSSSPNLFKKTLNVNSAPLREFSDSQPKPKTGGHKAGGVVVRKETDSASPIPMRRTLMDSSHQ
jgi:hypothetical protein